MKQILRKKNSEKCFMYGFFRPQFFQPPVTLLTVLVVLYGCHRNEVREQINVTEERPLPPVPIYLDSAAVLAFSVANGTPAPVANSVFDFYRNRKFEFAWMDSQGPNDHALGLLNLLADAEEEGVVIRDSVLLQLQEAADGLQNANRPLTNDSTSRCFELGLTATYFRYARAAYAGLSSDKLRELSWFIPPQRLPIQARLDSLFPDALQTLQFPEPDYPLYAQLKKWLKYYRLLEVTQPWDSLMLPSSSITVGDSNASLTAIRERLYLLQDISDSIPSAVADTVLFNGVRRFRIRHSLPAEGGMDSLFIRALNRSLRSRIRCLLVNMERCRWLPPVPRSRHLLVNIPEYRLYAYDHGVEKWNCGVIVGQATKSTVVFSGRLSKVIFSPYWNVPRSIIKEELLPAIKADPGYLSKNEFELRTLGENAVTVSPTTVNWKRVDPDHFPYEIRQLPGRKNALGRIKFMFPNNFSIYLHDTPARSLFGQPRRDFSHGCIRVEKPLELAAFVLNSKRWPRQRIHQLMIGGVETEVKLPVTVPVYVVYFTAWVDAAGRLCFADDLYGHDAKLENALLGP